MMFQLQFQSLFQSLVEGRPAATTSPADAFRALFEKLARPALAPTASDELPAEISSAVPVQGELPEDGTTTPKKGTSLPAFAQPEKHGGDQPGSVATLARALRPPVSPSDVFAPVSTTRGAGTAGAPLAGGALETANPERPTSVSIPAPFESSARPGENTRPFIDGPARWPVTGVTSEIEPVPTRFASDVPVQGPRPLAPAAPPALDQTVIPGAGELSRFAPVDALTTAPGTATVEPIVGVAGKREPSSLNLPQPSRAESIASPRTVDNAAGDRPAPSTSARPPHDLSAGPDALPRQESGTRASLEPRIRQAVPGPQPGGIVEHDPSNTTDPLRPTHEPRPGHDGVDLEAKPTPRRVIATVRTGPPVAPETPVTAYDMPARFTRDRLEGRRSSVDTAPRVTSSGFESRIDHRRILLGETKAVAVASQQPRIEPLARQVPSATSPTTATDPTPVFDGGKPAHVVDVPPATARETEAVRTIAEPASGNPPAVDPSFGRTSVPARAETPLAAPVRFEHLTQTILQQARQTAPDAPVELRFALHPAELGTVRIHIQARGEHLQIELVAQNNGATGALSAGLPRLVQHLHAAGFSDAEVTLALDTSADSSTHERQADRRSGHESSSADDRSSPQGYEISHTAEPRAHPGRGRLDRMA